MPRPSTFTDHEDRIILRYPGEPAEVVNAALEVAGFKARTASQITGRRHYLTRKKPSKGSSAQVASSTIGRLEAQRCRIESRLTVLNRERDTLIIEHREITERLRQAVADLEAASFEKAV